ncbi:MAG: class I SAM-dependent methyltransferase [Schleiferiaceae bacterium]
MAKPVKIFPNTVNGVVHTLLDIFLDGVYADKAIERTLKSNPKWGSRDRSFVAENVYDMVRWWRKLWALDGQSEIPTDLTPQSVERLFGIWWLYKGNTLPQWDVFQALQNFPIEDRKRELSSDLVIEQSYPEWIHRVASEELGETWLGIAAESNRPAEMIIRTNTLKATRDQVIKAFADQGIETLPLPFNEEGLVVTKRINLFRMPAFTKGWFEVQDGGSQMIAPFADIKPGQRIIDACAGAGGKSLHLAALLENKGQVLSMDVEGWKLNELKKRARRNGAHNIETRLIEGSKTIKRLAGKADRVLLDVPCTGLGVLKRNPDAKWKLKPETLETTRELQAQILSDYSKMVKPSGKLVYATCSILPSENQNQVKSFLEGVGKDFTLVEDKTQYPSEHTDGFYMALLERKG